MTVRELLQHLIKVTGIRELGVVVEPWPWFISNEDFPVLDAYRLQSEPPSNEEYYDAYKIECSSTLGHSPGCSTFGKKASAY
jgi:hypothetical protein